MTSTDSAPGPADPPHARETSSGELAVPAETTEPAAAPPRRRGCLRLFAWLAAALAAVLVWQVVTWPDVAALATEDPESSAFMRRYERRHGSAPAHTWVSYGRISPHLKRAVLVAEDINFFSHDGFDRTEIRAAWEEAKKERKLPRGASTLSQQLAKNLWLSPSRNPLRKAKEVLLTRQLEHHLGKRRILELYLNFAELGPGIYGAEAAARHYFGTSAASLSEGQAAALAAGLPNPRDWHPGSQSRRYQNRVRTIQRRMAKASFLRRQI